MNPLHLTSLLLAANMPAFCDRLPQQSGKVKEYIEALPLQEEMNTRFFSSREFSLCVVDEGGGKPAHGSLKTAMQANGCVAGVNGGYFGADKQRTPLGLVRHGGINVTPLSTRGFAVSGILYDTGTGIYLERSNALSHPVGEMREAVQGGPFLVENGKPVAGLNATRRARRTIIATDGQGNWCLAVTAPITLQQLADKLSRPGCLGGFRVKTALNLDGGTSSAMWDSTDGTRVHNLKPVRNYVGITPRKPEAHKGKR